MAKTCAILVDLDACVGCYACEVACKQENQILEGDGWIKVIPVGPEEVDGKLRMDFLVRSDPHRCDFCRKRLKEGQLPACVDNCPFEALLYCPTEKTLLSALSTGMRVHVCRLETPIEGFA